VQFLFFRKLQVDILLYDTLHPFSIASTYEPESLSAIV
jgi:hypothetical protein